MSVIVNEAAIAAFFEKSPQLAAVVEVEAARIVEAMQDDVRSYFVGAETGVENDVGLRMEGTRAVVGLQNDPEGHSTHPENTKAARYARVGRWEITRARAAGR